jgi:SAM-dependent methyltransferase
VEALVPRPTFERKHETLGAQVPSGVLRAVWPRPYETAAPFRHSYTSLNGVRGQAQVLDVRNARRTPRRERQGPLRRLAALPQNAELLEERQRVDRERGLAVVPRRVDVVGDALEELRGRSELSPALSSGIANVFSTRCATARRKKYRMAGDWYLYAAAAASGRKVAYVAEALNLHRRHEGARNGLSQPRRACRRGRACASLRRGCNRRQRADARADGRVCGSPAGGVRAAEDEGQTASVEALASSALTVPQDRSESPYYEDAERAMEVFWGDGSPFLELFRRLDLTTVAVPACGHGRHAQHIAARAGELFVIDIHESNIAFSPRAIDRLQKRPVSRKQGVRSASCERESLSAIFCYDAMVHFPPDVIESYLSDTLRVLRRGGLALYHHSNYDAPDSRHYGLNPRARNRMTRAEFGRLAEAAGLEVVVWRLVDWGGVPALDCLTLVRKPNDS